MALELVTEETTVTVEAGTAVGVGRLSSVDLRIDDPLVSREHLRVFSADANWVVEDVGSSNGTYVDGERIQSLVVQGEVELRLGDPATGPTLRLVPIVPRTVQETVARPARAEPAARKRLPRPRPAPNRSCRRLLRRLPAGPCSRSGGANRATSSSTIRLSRGITLSSACFRRAAPSSSISAASTGRS